MDLLERLKLKFKPQAFGDVVTADGMDSDAPPTSDPFTARLTAYIADATAVVATFTRLTDPLLITNAIYQYTLFLAYDDMIIQLIQAFDQEQAGQTQTARTNLNNRLEELTSRKNEAKANFDRLVTPPVEEPRKPQRSGNVDVTSGW
ncbi:hypothetical protein [Deinococcus misasensis]|uniref:hypothetical protein n=1 Tax=Deinococcus misasensis TaxID=392413 RepID=UPI0005598835|nr:hypothetical protein [Deinococcus misasensis]